MMGMKKVTLHSLSYVILRIAYGGKCDGRNTSISK